MAELWKDYIYVYQVSNLGRVRNKITNKIMAKKVNDRGYEEVNVTLGSRKLRKCIRVHRAVAELFIPNPQNKPQVNHKDGVKTNNAVDNLE